MPEMSYVYHYDHIIVHCSATARHQDIGSVEIDRWHKERGWRGCGYHVVVRRDGVVETLDEGYPTRPFDQAGAHVGDCGLGWNRRSLGICLVGGIDDEGRPEYNFHSVQMESLRAFIASVMDAFVHVGDLKILPPKLMGHRDLIRITGASPKACPCFDVATWWKGLPTEPFKPDPEEDDKNAGTGLSLGGYWVVRQGDTLWSIASVTGVPISTLRRLNPFVIDSDDIFPGNTIVLR